MPEEGFRRQVYGFNKDDVLAYVVLWPTRPSSSNSQYEEQITQLKAQLDKLRQDQQNARACVDKLQSDLLTQTSRAEKAEGDLAAANKKLSEYQDELKLSESHATTTATATSRARKTLLEWQNRCRELEQQLQDARAAASRGRHRPDGAGPAGGRGAFLLLGPTGGCGRSRGYTDPSAAGARAGPG